MKTHFEWPFGQECILAKTWCRRSDATDKSQTGFDAQRGCMRSRTLLIALSFALTPVALSQNVRLTNDVAGGYTSVYTLATGTPYTDAVLAECSIARGRQNEPAVAADPRDTRVLIGSSNDYCGVYAGSTTTFVPAGPLWLGYYRSENGGKSFQSSLVPGYPGDVSPYAALAQIRTAGAGDPVIAWDGHGRVFMGSESSGDPEGTAKTFGDEWVARFDNPMGENGPTRFDGKRFLGSTVVAKGSSAPNLLGKFNDKTSIEADRTGGRCDANVYFGWSRFTGNGRSNIYFSRSIDHGATWSAPMLLTSNIANVQNPSIAVTGNGHVYVTFDMGALNNGQPDGIGVAKSSNCGATFSKATVLTTYIPYNAQDIQNPQPIPPPGSAIDDPLDTDTSAPEAVARDCGDFDNACKSGYTFFRRASSTIAKADQQDNVNEFIYLVFDATIPGTAVRSGTSYGSVSPGVASQPGAYFLRYNGATGVATPPKLIDPQPAGHQLFPAISVEGGFLHALWWDSRNDLNYSPQRPVGNDAAGKVGSALDVYASKSIDGGKTWSTSVRLSDTTTNPNFEQFSNRTVPFAGDYLWITSIGQFAFGVWTDWRNTVAGSDPREIGGSNEGADVKQCRTFNPGFGWSGDQCPHDGGIDQNIYGSQAP